MQAVIQFLTFLLGALIGWRVSAWCSQYRAEKARVERLAREAKGAKN